MSNKSIFSEKFWAARQKYVQPLPAHIRLEVNDAIWDYLESGQVANNLKPRARVVFELLLPLLPLPSKEEPKQFELSFAEEIPVDRIESVWKSVCVPAGLPMPKSLPEQRRAKLRSRWKQWSQDGNPLEVFQQICQIISKTPFLCGENANNWKATFDWVIQNDRNWLKILEGNYEKSNTYNYGAYTNRKVIASPGATKFTRKSCI